MSIPLAIDTEEVAALSQKWRVYVDDSHGGSFWEEYNSEAEAQTAAKNHLYYDLGCSVYIARSIPADK